MTGVVPSTGPTSSSPGRMIWLVRHGTRSDEAALNRAAGQTRPWDPPLAACGRRQAAAIAANAAIEDVDHVVASPAVRTVETAAPVAERLGLPLRLEDGLGEFLNPAWFDEEPSWHRPVELVDRFPCIEIASSFATPAFPESVSSFVRRCASTMRHLLHELRGNLLVVCHGATIAALAYSMLGPVSVDVAPGAAVRLVQLDTARWRIEWPAFAAEQTVSR